MAPSTTRVVAAGRRKVAVELAVVAFVLYTIYKRLFRCVKGAPYRPGWPILGNLLECIRAVKVFGIHAMLHRWHKDHGLTVVGVMPGQPYVIDTTDPRNVEHILKTRFDIYVKGDWSRDRLSDLLGNGIFNVDGAMWHTQRKTASKMFTQNQFKNHIWRVVDKNTAKVVEILKSTAPGETIDFFNLMNRFTLDTIGESGFSKDIGSLANPDSPFLKSFDRCQQIAAFRFLFPAHRLRKWLGIGGEGAEGIRHFASLDKYARTVVRELRARLRVGEAGDSFVGLFAKEMEAAGDKWDEDFMRDMVLNFLIAGRDTTAQGLAWCLYLIMTSSGVEEKIVEEVQTICGDDDLTYDKLNKLIYVQAVVNESLRLYPSVPIDQKVALADDTLPDGTWLPKGTVIQFNPYSMGRAPQLWGKDVEQFRPDRWLSAEVPNTYEYPVFNAGPRECLGKRLAYVEMKTLLVGIFRVASFKLAVPADEILPDLQLTLGMSTGLPVKVELRSVTQAPRVTS